MLKMLKNKIGGMMMMPSGMEIPCLIIGLVLGIFILIAVNHFTGSNICGMWAYKGAAAVVTAGAP